MRRKRIILLLLTLFPILSSALIAPGYFAPLRVPLYTIAIVITILSMLTRTYQFIIRVAWYQGIFVVLVLLSSAYNSILDSPVMHRQVLVYISLLFCVYIGFLAFRIAVEEGVNYAHYLSVIFIILFVYGVYTYFAQKYGLYEILYFLRPSPAVRFINESQIFQQEFFGALNRFRAYSVWYEPSYASLALSSALPLLFLSKSKKITAYSLITSGIFAFLTYSRSAWFVYIVFIIIYFWSIFKIRLFTGLFFILIASSIPILYYASYMSTLEYSDTSAFIRFYNSYRAMSEIYHSLGSTVFGLGTPDLFNPIVFNNTLSFHITNGFIAVFHWIGILGLIFFLSPFFILIFKAKKCNQQVYWAVVSFVLLACVTLNISGNYFGISILWFFIGIYYALTIHSAEVNYRSFKY